MCVSHNMEPQNSQMSFFSRSPCPSTKRRCQSVSEGSESLPLLSRFSWLTAATEMPINLLPQTWCFEALFPGWPYSLECTASRGTLFREAKALLARLAHHTSYPSPLALCSSWEACWSLISPQDPRRKEGSSERGWGTPPWSGISGQG